MSLYAALMEMRRRDDRERLRSRESAARQRSRSQGRRGLKTKGPAFGELSYDVKMTRVSLPIAQFEFTKKSQESMRRLVWTNDTDCAINALQVTGVIGSWCADMMRIMMRDTDTGAVRTCNGVTGVRQRVLEMAYEHAYCMPFEFTPIKRRDLVLAVQYIELGHCIVVSTPAHVSVIVMSNQGPRLADLQLRGYDPIDRLLTGKVSVMRYDPDVDTAVVGSVIGSERCKQDTVHTRPIEPLYF